jgi:hypothetical protein
VHFSGAEGRGAGAPGGSVGMLWHCCRRCRPQWTLGLWQNIPHTGPEAPRTQKGSCHQEDARNLCLAEHFKIPLVNF